MGGSVVDSAGRVEIAILSEEAEQKTVHQICWSGRCCSCRRGCYGAGRLGFLNRAPIADFEYVLLSSDCPPDFEFGTSQRTLHYIRANSEEEITFLSNCLSDHYSHVWHVDDKIVAETSDYFAKLSPGESRIRATIAT